jgi:transposase
MPRSCSICSHPQGAAISKDLAAGASIRSAASRFGVTPATAHRHLDHCMGVKRRAEQGVKAAQNGGRDSSTPAGADSSRFASEAPTDRCPTNYSRCTE